MTAQEKLAPLAAKLHAALADEKQRVNLLVCTGLAGLVLLGVTAWLPAGNSTQSPQTVQTDTAADYATQLESRLTALISRVEGAGKTAVMVTLESGSESIYATDTDADGASTHVPSHLMWMGGDPVAAVHKLGADRIYHVHAKDVRIERNYIGPDGVLDTKTIDQFAKRTWNYVALGHGHDVSWWKEFLSCLSMEGYDGPISQEMEDLTMPALTGLKKSTTVLKEAMPCDL